MTFNTFIYLAIVGGVWAFLWWYFANFVIGSMVNFEYMQNADGKRAVQEILHTEEAWQEKHEDGDPPEPGSERTSESGG